MHFRGNRDKGGNMLLRVVLVAGFLLIFAGSSLQRGLVGALMVGVGSGLAIGAVFIRATQISAGRGVKN